MSRTPIKKDILCELWWRAAGRCEFKGCNRRLDLHFTTMDKCRLSNYAHIIADSPNGPRGNEHSKELANNIDNIMLMCQDCHKYIDNEGKDKYSADTLRAMKQRHEDRMEFLTGLSEDLQARIVTYGSKVGDQLPDFSFNMLQKALLPHFYPATSDIIDLGGMWPTKETWEDYWQNEVEYLEYHCKDKILNVLNKWENKRIALFGFAPMPLLVKLGTILNNKHNVEVFQRQRNGDWSWPCEDKHVDYIIKKPDNIGEKPILVLSLSFPISDRIRLKEPNASIWELTIDHPNPDYLQSKSMLYDFGRKIELILDEINKSFGNNPLDLYMSVPVACAIEFGRVWMQKANVTLNIYDFDKRYGEHDKLAIVIENK